MKGWFAAAIVTVSLAGVSLAYAGDVASGLRPGDEPPAFDVQDATGPAAGTFLCYRCRYGNSPVVSIFTKKIDDHVTQLIKQVDKQVGQNKDKNLRAFVVLLTDDPDGAEPQLKELAKTNQIKNVPLTIFDGPAGPPEYQLSDKADVTVLMWVKGEEKVSVRVNHAIAPGKLDAKEIESIVKDTQKILN